MTLGDGQAVGQPQVLWEGAVTPGGKKSPQEGFVLLAGRFWGAPC